MGNPFSAWVVLINNNDDGNDKGADNESSVTNLAALHKKDEQNTHDSDTKVWLLDERSENPSSVPFRKFSFPLAFHESNSRGRLFIKYVRLELILACQVYSKTSTPVNPETSVKCEQQNFVWLSETPRENRRISFCVLCMAWCVTTRLVSEHTGASQYLLRFRWSASTMVSDSATAAPVFYRGVFLAITRWLLKPFFAQLTAPHPPNQSATHNINQFTMWRYLCKTHLTLSQKRCKNVAHTSSFCPATWTELQSPKEKGRWKSNSWEYLQLVHEKTEFPPKTEFM